MKESHSLVGKSKSIFITSSVCIVSISLERSVLLHVTDRTIVGGKFRDLLETKIAKIGTPRK